MRRITAIEEIVGAEGERIETRTLFAFKPGPPCADGKLTGHFYGTKQIPEFFSRAEYYGLGSQMMACLQSEDVAV